MANKGAFKKGDPRAGRKAGSPNKLTQDLRDMILGALSAAGGQDYLQKQSRDNPAAFMALLGKTLPKDINLTPGVRIEVNLVGSRRCADSQLPTARPG